MNMRFVPGDRVVVTKKNPMADFYPEPGEKGTILDSMQMAYVIDGEVADEWVEWVVELDNPPLDVDDDDADNPLFGNFYGFSDDMIDPA